MRHRQILTVFLLFTTINLSGQDLFFIGEKSYPCTETIVLISNKEDSDDLKILFAKDDSSKYVAVFTKPKLNSDFTGKLIIYLDDGTVIACENLIESDFVDDIAKAVFVLNEKDLSKLKKSNINTVRFTLRVLDLKDVNHSASNKNSHKTDFMKIINEFFD
ncbi:hypothetical protein [uncultured Psychroserpens sp.]|uniref:hypothetical protein n=1 Tax=uncultured Psychroserpens sp. TaxID=255436 RepID=UPI00261239FF|nr:hypothetical protein [uncultured Psychroserpens sp.]